MNQLDGLEHVVVTAGTGVPTSGLLLGVDAWSACLTAFCAALLAGTFQARRRKGR